MGGEVCKRAGYERGPWFEIKCVTNTIRLKEAKGKDASYERGLLNHWKHYDGYRELAKEALAALV